MIWKRSSSCGRIEMIESISLTPAPPGPPERYINVGPLVLPTRARRSGTVPGSAPVRSSGTVSRSEEHTSELQSLAYLVCRLLLEKKKHKAKERIQLKNKKTKNSKT